MVSQTGVCDVSACACGEEELDYSASTSSYHPFAPLCASTYRVYCTDPLPLPPPANLQTYVSQAQRLPIRSQRDRTGWIDPRRVAVAVLVMDATRRVTSIVVGHYRLAVGPHCSWPSVVGTHRLAGPWAT